MTNPSDPLHTELVLPAGSRVSSTNKLPVNSGFYGTDGNTYNYKVVDGKPRICVDPYVYEIAEGNFTDKKSWSKTGYNPDIGTTEEDMWGVGGKYVFPTAEMKMEVVSSDNTADIPAGTGALTVYINYLNGDYIEKTTTVILNGTTPVETSVSDIFRIQNFRVASTGTDGMPKGNIDIRNTSDTPIYGRISAGVNRARSCIWTVPAGKTLYVNNLFFSSGGTIKPVFFSTKTTYDDIAETNLTAGLFFMPYTDIQCNDNAIDITLGIPTKLPEKTDIKVSVVGNQAGALGLCFLKGWIQTNS